MKTIKLAILFLFISPNMAFAFCFEPSAPSAPSIFWKPQKPNTPYCVNTFTNTHTCSDWEIDSYNREVERYNSEIEDYVFKLQQYVNEAIEFANAADAYARCEINNLD